MRTDASGPFESVRKLENWALRRKNAEAFGIRSWSRSVVAWNIGSDSNRFCIGRSRSR